jgi:hypothetical protein
MFDSVVAQGSTKIDQPCRVGIEMDASVLFLLIQILVEPRFGRRRAYRHSPAESGTAKGG